MQFFSSKRERRLWAWTLAFVIAIYSTLGLASLLADAFQNQALSAVVFLVCMFLIGVTVLTQGLKTRPGGVEIGVGLGIAAVYAMVFLRLTMSERSHLIEYSVVAVFVFEALTERSNNGRRVPVPAVLAILATSLVGAFDEFVQLVLPNRFFEWIDILFNSLAALTAVASMVVLGWARRLTQRIVQRNK